MPSVQRFFAYALAYLFSGIFLGVGPFLLLLALISVVRTEAFIHSSIPAEGKVVELRRVHGGGSRGGWYFAPVFEFTAQDGQTYMHVSGTSTNPPQFKVGDHVKVFYAPGHPELARINTPGQLFLFPMVATAIGGAMTALSVALLRRRQRQRVVVTL